MLRFAARAAAKRARGARAASSAAPPVLDEKWRALAANDLKGTSATPDSLAYTTPEGLVLKPVYTPADVEGLATTLPGEFPCVFHGRFCRDVAATAWDLRAARPCSDK